MIESVYNDIKIARNTSINHIIVCFTNHNNATSTDRLPSKSKIGNHSYFNNSFLCKAEVPSATKTFLFVLKTVAVDPRHLKLEIAD